MKWSKLKKETESNFCDGLRKRISINSTAYGNCSCGHARVTYDKELVANFCTRAFWNTDPEYDKESKRWIKVKNIESNKYNYLLNDYGDLSRQGVYESCWDYLNSIPIEKAIKSNDIFLQFLSIVDKRMWKRTLKKINKDELVPFVQFFYIERLKVEGII